MTTKINIKFTLPDESHFSRTFDKIGGTISIDSAKNLAKTILPLVGATKADVTASNYQSEQVAAV